ncbi:MAG TPA: phage head closure protein [Ktedonobacteraceae bacterium]|nr:phage head closure protein [Ktedonobacteraceae bacterium]
MPVNDPSIIKSGELNRRIELRKPVDTPDGQRGFTRTYATVPGCRSVPAAMTYSAVPRRGDESWVAQQVYVTTFVLFKIRYRPSLNIHDKMIVVYGKKTFNIRSVFVPKERQTVIMLQCEEIQSQGSLH